ncbi:MAG: hypothetical protein AB1656_26080, partial [Candidatus Omnitrophota bacterium]
EKRRFALPQFTFEQEERARLLPSQGYSVLFLSAIAEFLGVAAHHSSFIIQEGGKGKVFSALEESIPNVSYIKRD